MPVALELLFLEGRAYFIPTVPLSRQEQASGHLACQIVTPPKELYPLRCATKHAQRITATTRNHRCVLSGLLGAEQGPLADGLRC